MDLYYNALATVQSGFDQTGRKLRRDFNALRAGELSGQGLIEYVLIIAVISLVIVAAGPYIYDAINHQFNVISDTLNDAPTGRR